uniref:Reverse transcriptase domain-containing protein n=1 Tax=Strongyloides venezuelensis TaxID=75913 RepID=A0A0K0FG00_STRVS
MTKEFNQFTEDLGDNGAPDGSSISSELLGDLLEEWDDTLLPSAPKMTIGERECAAMGRLLLRAPREAETVKKIEEDFGFHKDVNFIPPGLPIFMYTRLAKLPQRNSMEKQLKEIQTNLLQGLALVSKDLSQIKDIKQFFAGIYRLCNANALINGARRENTLEAMNVACGVKLHAPKHPLVEEEKLILGEHSYINLFPSSLKTLLKDKYNPQMESLEVLLTKSRKRPVYTPQREEEKGYVFRIQNYYNKWSDITSDPYILKIIKEGVQLGFLSTPSTQTSPLTYDLKVEDRLALDELVLSLNERKIIQEVGKSSLKWCNPIFNVPRKNGSPRLIVDLSPLNTNLNVEHLKLKDITSAIDLAFDGCFFLSIDLSDAYYSIGVKEEETYFLGIKSRERFFKFNSLPFGVATAPKFFTRITHDFLIVAVDYTDGCNKAAYITELLTGLGFLINKEKSQLVPKSKILYLGFVISNRGILYVPEEKIGKILSFTDDLIILKRVKCRTVAKYLGICTTCCRGIRNLAVYLRNLQQQLFLALNGTTNYERFLSLSVETKEDLVYIKNNIRRYNEVNFLKTSAYVNTIYSDASLEGWGAACNGEFIKGTFPEKFKDEIIAIKEMLAIEYSTAYFIKDRTEPRRDLDSHFTIKSDSLVCIYLLQRGGTTRGPRAPILNEIIKDILHNIENHKVFYKHISDILNTKADQLSREELTKEEISVGMGKRTSLKSLILKRLSLIDMHIKNDKEIDTLFNLYFIDIFASNANKMCSDFYSLYPQPNMLGMNAFLLPWHERDKFYYIFPPTNMILKTLNKLLLDQRYFGGFKFVILLPLWEGCIWHPLWNEQFKPHKSFVQTWSLHSLREELERELSLDVAETILASWSDNTKKVYTSACTIWLNFCKAQHREISNTSISQLTDFIVYLKRQYSVNSVQTISAGITSLLHLSGRSLSEREKELLQRTLKGSTRLSLLTTPKVIDNHIWNLGEFLSVVKRLPVSEDVMFYAQKAATLLMIVSPQRVSEIATIKTTNIQFFETHAIFHVTVPTKTKPFGFHFRIESFQKILPFRRTDDDLFVTVKGSKKKATTSTIQRWIKLFLLKGNVDPRAHSIRKSSSSWLFKKVSQPKRLRNCAIDPKMDLHGSASITRISQKLTC